jgi:hypothetical protein
MFIANDDIIYAVLPYRKCVCRERAVNANCQFFLLRQYNPFNRPMRLSSLGMSKAYTDTGYVLFGVVRKPRKLEVLYVHVRSTEMGVSRKETSVEN